MKASVDLSPGGATSQLMQLGTSRYELTIRLEPAVVDTGWRTDGRRRVRAHLRVSGWGPLNLGKIWVDLPVALLDEKNPGTAVLTWKIAKTPPHTRLVDERQETGLQSSGFVVSGLESLGLPAIGVQGPGHVPPVTGELVNRFGAPVVMELNIRRDAPAGDHPVNAVFTYWNSVRWESSRTTVTLHINNWHDRWGEISDPVTFVVGVLAGFVLGVLTVFHP